MQGSPGNWLIVAGIVLVVAGLAFKAGVLGWFGHLPGDIQVKRENFQFYLPLSSMIVLSILLSVIAAVVRRFF